MRPTVRLAWLLVVSRLLHPDPAMVSRARFVDQLRDRQIAADASRVSRWESGQHPVPVAVLETYEHLLGFPRWSIVALDRGLSRHSGEDLLRLSGAGEDPAEALERQLDAAISTEPGARLDLTGADWLALVDRLTGFDAVFLGRRGWADLCHRLLTEMSAATGTEERLRWEAAATLMGHPVAARHLTDAITGWVRIPHSQRVVPTVFLLAESGIPSGDDMLLGLLTRPGTSIIARDAAATAAAVRLARGQVDAATTQLLERYATAQLRGTEARPSVPTLELAVHLSPPQLARALGQVSDPGLRRRIHELTEHRLLLPRKLTRRIARTVTRSVRAAVPGPVDLVPDPLLERLVTESLFHLSVHRRWLASTVLGLSPYGPPLMEEFLDLASGSDAPLASTAWRAVLALGDENPSPRLAPLALAESRRGMQAVALNAMSRSSQELLGGELDAAAATATGAETPGTRMAAVTVLARQAPERLPELLGVSDTMDSAVQWWQSLRPTVPPTPSGSRGATARSQ